MVSPAHIARIEHEAAELPKLKELQAKYERLDALYEAFIAKILLCHPRLKDSPHIIDEIIYKREDRRGEKRSKDSSVFRLETERQYQRFGDDLLVPLVNTTMSFLQDCGFVLGPRNIDGKIYYKGYEDYHPANITCPPENVDEAIAKLGTLRQLSFKDTMAAISGINQADSNRDFNCNINAPRDKHNGSFNLKAEFDARGKANLVAEVKWKTDDLCHLGANHIFLLLMFPDKTRLEKEETLEFRTPEQLKTLGALTQALVSRCYVDTKKGLSISNKQIVLRALVEADRLDHDIIRDLAEKNGVDLTDIIPDKWRQFITKTPRTGRARAKVAADEED